MRGQMISLTGTTRFERDQNNPDPPVIFDLVQADFALILRHAPVILVVVAKRRSVTTWFRNARQRQLTSHECDSCVFEEWLDEIKHRRELGEDYRLLAGEFTLVVFAHVDLLEQLEQLANLGRIWW